MIQTNFSLPVRLKARMNLKFIVRYNYRFMVRKGDLLV